MLLHCYAGMSDDSWHCACRISHLIMSKISSSPILSLLIFWESGDSAVSLEATSRVEHACVHHLTRLYWHIVGTQLLHNWLHSFSLRENLTYTVISPLIDRSKASSQKCKTLQCVASIDTACSAMECYKWHHYFCIPLWCIHASGGK